MKKLFVLSAVFFLVSSLAFSQTVPPTNSSEAKLLRKDERRQRRKLMGTEVSKPTRDAFANDFGKVDNAVWVRENDMDQVSFMKNGQEMTAYYDADSKLIGTVTNKTFADLPVKAQMFINDRYGDYTKGDVIYFDDNELNTTDMELFGADFNYGDTYFVELKKGAHKLVLASNTAGQVSMFKKLY